MYTFIIYFVQDQVLYKNKNLQEHLILHFLKFSHNFQILFALQTERDMNNFLTKRVVNVMRICMSQTSKPNLIEKTPKQRQNNKGK